MCEKKCCTIKFYFEMYTDRFKLHPILALKINMQKLQLATDKFDPDFIERRRQGLEVILRVHISYMSK